MGGNVSQNRSHRSSSFKLHTNQGASGLNQISSKLDEKDTVFVAMQSDIDKAIKDNDQQQIKSLIAEIDANLVDLSQIHELEELRKSKSTNNHYRRIRHGFEMSLATLKSTLEITPKPNEVRGHNPDLVSDLITFDSSSDRHSFKNDNMEVKLQGAEAELGVLKDNLERPYVGADTFCRIDKGAFYLQTELNSLKIPNGTPLSERKFRLLEDLAAFRRNIEQKMEDLEEQQELSEEIIKLQSEFQEASSESEFKSVHSRALLLHETLQKFKWSVGTGVSKIQLQGKLKALIEATAASDNSEEIYANIDKGHKSGASEELESIASIDRVLQEHTDSYEDQTASCENDKMEKSLQALDTELAILIDNLEMLEGNADTFCQIDKAAFYLQAKLNSLNTSDDTLLHQWKFRLLGDLTEFRRSIEKKMGNLGEQEELGNEVMKLEAEFKEATSESEFKSLNSRALLLREILQKSEWIVGTGVSKAELLKKLERVIEAATPAVSPEQIYENLNDFETPGTTKELESIASIDHDDTYGKISLKSNCNSKISHSEEDEEIYGNVELIRQLSNKTPLVEGQRGTIYVNEGVIREYQHTSTRNKDKHQTNLNKPPLPLPRNFEDKLIADLPRNWHRLTKILEKSSISETEMAEVAEIRRQAEIAKSMFERKIKKILQRCEEAE